MRSCVNLPSSHVTFVGIFGILRMFGILRIFGILGIFGILRILGVLRVFGILGVFVALRVAGSFLTRHGGGGAFRFGGGYCCGD